MLRWMSPFLLWIGILGLQVAYSHAHAQVTSVQISAPRPAGWIVGDIVPVTIDIVTVDSPLHRSALPQPGPINYWLDLRSVDIQERSLDAERHYKIVMNYQSFYVPLDVNAREIPGFDLVFGEGANAETVSIEPQRFFMSPLRPVASSGVSVSEQIQDDATAQLIPTRKLHLAVAVLVVVIVLLLIVLAIYYSVWPFQRRRSRPLAHASGQIRRLLRSHDSDAYRNSLIQLHRALDTSNNGRLLSSDVSSFVSRQPEFTSVQAEITQFFQASACLFFTGDHEQAVKMLAPQDLSRIARRLAAAERRIS